MLFLLTYYRGYSILDLGKITNFVYGKEDRIKLYIHVPVSRARRCLGRKTNLILILSGPMIVIQDDQTIEVGSTISRKDLVVIKKFKEVFCLLLSCVMLFVSMPATSARGLLETDQYDVLYERGYTKEMIDIMDPQYRDSLITTLRHSPEKVQTFKTTMEVDMAEELERFLDMSDQELLNMGISKDEMELQRNKAREMLAASMARGTIDSNVLTFIVTAEDVSASANSVKYNISISFSWKKPFLMDAFTDKIAVVWGGDLLESNISKGNVNYYRFLKPNTWNDFFARTEMNRDDTVPNESILMTFSQHYNSLAQPRIGGFSFTLSRNKRVGEDTYVIARYGHALVKITGAGITWGFPSLSFGIDYDQTSIDNGKIKISY